MSNGPKRITDLPVTTTTTPATDLMVIVQQTGGVNTTYAIAPSVLLAQTAFFTANNANYLGGVVAASYQLNSTLAANLTTLMPAYANVVNASTFSVATAFIANSTAVYAGNSTANVQIGGISVAGTPTALAGQGSSNSSIDIVISNANNGANASSDFAAYDNAGLATQNFIDMGISSSGYTQSFWTIGGASDGYLYTGNTNLSIGTASASGGGNYINFFANGTLITNEVMKITPLRVNIGNQAAGLVSLTVGNATVNTVINSTAITLGTATAAANGTTTLPNGLRMNWGWVAANSTVGAVTFTTAFTANAYVVLATSNSAVATYGAAVIAWDKLGTSIRTANATSTNVFWQAIGT